MFSLVHVCVSIAFRLCFFSSFYIYLTFHPPVTVFQHPLLTPSAVYLLSPAIGLLHLKCPLFFAPTRGIKYESYNPRLCRFAARRSMYLYEPFYYPYLTCRYRPQPLHFVAKMLRLPNAQKTVSLMWTQLK